MDQSELTSLPFTRVKALVFLLGNLYHAAGCPMGPIGTQERHERFLDLGQAAFEALGVTNQELRAAVEAAPFLEAP